MTQLKNAKVLPKGDKLLLIDAPEMPNADGKCISLCEYKDHSLCVCRNKFKEALSKAPTWEIKNGEEMKRKLWERTIDILHEKDQIDLVKNIPNYNDWQPEQGKLYDIPAPYTYKFEKVYPKHFVYNPEENCILFAILIPQEAVKYLDLLTGDKIKIDSGFGFPDFGRFLRYEDDKIVWQDNEGDTYSTPLMGYKVTRTEEVKEESQEDLIIELVKFITSSRYSISNERIEQAKSKFKITRL
jgi:hypothetical protein